MGCWLARMRPLSLLLAAHTGAAARRAARATGTARRAVLGAGAVHALLLRAATGAAAASAATIARGLLLGAAGTGARGCSSHKARPWRRCDARQRPPARLNILMSGQAGQRRKKGPLRSPRHFMPLT